MKTNTLFSFLTQPDLGDDAVLVRLNQDVVAPEGPAAATPADPTQTETLHRVLTGQRGHAPLRHFKTGNGCKVSTCSTETRLTHLYTSTPERCSEETLWFRSAANH